MRFTAAFVCLLVAIAPYTVRSTTAAPPPSVYLGGFPTLRQEHPLTCEASTTSMGTRARLSEAMLMARIGRNADPNLGFRGNPDGRQGPDLRNYGVYPAPLVRALASYGYASRALYDASDYGLTQWVRRGWPVVTWITYALRPERPRWVIEHNHGFVLVPLEHTVLVVGFSQTGVIANDPWTGKQVSYRWGSFNRSWAYLGRMGLAIAPCTAPAPVHDAVPQRIGRIATWTWMASPGAARYQLTLLRYMGSERWRTIRAFTQKSTTYAATIDPHATYDLQIIAVAACGPSSPVLDSVSSPPAPVSTPTPMPTSTTPPTATSPPTATVMPSPTISGTVTANSPP